MGVPVKEEEVKLGKAGELIASKIADYPRDHRLDSYFKAEYDGMFGDHTVLGMLHKEFEGLAKCMDHLRDRETWIAPMLRDIEEYNHADLPVVGHIYQQLQYAQDDISDLVEIEGAYLRKLHDLVKGSQVVDFSGVRLTFDDLIRIQSVRDKVFGEVFRNREDATSYAAKVTTRRQSLAYSLADIVNGIQSIDWSKHEAEPEGDACDPEPPAVEAKKLLCLPYNTVQATKIAQEMYTSLIERINRLY